MSFAETIRAYLGWCPVARNMQANLPVFPEVRTDGVSGGRDGASAAASGWWSRYRNQVLVSAVVLSAAAAALFLLVEDVAEYRIVPMAIAIGAGSAVGLLISYRKWFGRVAAGEFAQVCGTGRQRIIRRVRALALSMPAFFVVLIVAVVGFALSGMVGQTLAFVLGASFICWNQYCFTLLWERQHRAILIAERGSMYIIETAVHGEGGSI